MKKVFLAILIILLLSCSVNAGDVAISWEYDPDMDNVDGFKIYMTTTSGEYTEEDVLADIPYESGQGEYSTTKTIQGEEGVSTTYYFVATAYNESTESEYSDEVSTDILGSPTNFNCSIITE